MLTIFQNRNLVLEVREGLTGFSVEVNHVQVFWTDSRDEAERLYGKLYEAFATD